MAQGPGPFGLATCNILIKQDGGNTGTSPNDVQRPPFLVTLRESKENLPCSPPPPPRLPTASQWPELHHVLTPKPIAGKDMGSISPHPVSFPENTRDVHRAFAHAVPSLGMPFLIFPSRKVVFQSHLQKPSLTHRLGRGLFWVPTAFWDPTPCGLF